jgi:hypothetical protein
MRREVPAFVGEDAKVVFGPPISAFGNVHGAVGNGVDGRGK